MSLSSITSVPQSASFELLSTQLKNPPALTNNSGSTVTVAITATGEWSLLKADFATSDPDIIRYKKLVDGDGIPREKRDEKFKFKYPNLNPAILVEKLRMRRGIQNPLLVANNRALNYNQETRYPSSSTMILNGMMTTLVS